MSKPPVHFMLLSRRASKNTRLRFLLIFVSRTVATMFVELSTRETQGLHFALNGFGWTLGMLVASVLGPPPSLKRTP